jgi:hypothetical protein
MTRAPLLWPSVLTPAAEIDEVKYLNALLSGVEYGVKAWEAALALYRTSLSPPSSISKEVASQWRWIACNECILELYHLRSRMEKIQAVQLRKCSSLLPWIDSGATRGARKRLDEYFPDIEALRHATAHKGENEVNSDAHAPEGQRFALAGFREPHRYSTPYLGKLRSLDITEDSLHKVIEVVDAYLSGFVQAAEELERQGHLD